MLADLLSWFIVITAVILILQSAFSLAQTLYIWNAPDRVRAAGEPETLEEAHHGFTVLLPARHESEVIGETLRMLGEANYPKSKLELLVICTSDDVETIAAAEETKQRHGLTNVRVLTFENPPGKSKAMNLGLAAATHELVTVFDSEDDVSPDIFSIANTLFLRRQIDVLQCGVQLMDYDSHWYSAHNVLEYFFWFKSRMHYFARLGAVPLGGNTVFFRTSDLKEVGGWDERGLTEDADLGIRLSIAGKVFDVMYDARHVTKEEVPHSTTAFVKQRTRWNQGFLQIMRKGDWLRLPGLDKLLVVTYVLTAPTYMALIIATAPLYVIIGLTVKLPEVISLFTFIPLLLAVVMLMVSMLGLYEFGKDQGLRVRLRSYAMLVVAFLPYQAVLMVSAVRATAREFRGSRGWEKTAHTGNHRGRANTGIPVGAGVNEA